MRVPPIQAYQLTGIEQRHRVDHEYDQGSERQRLTSATREHALLNGVNANRLNEALQKNFA